jgi:hypothetical protein
LNHVALPKGTTISSSMVSIQSHGDFRKMSAQVFRECATKASPKFIMVDVLRRSINCETQNEVIGDTCFCQGKTISTFFA